MNLKLKMNPMKRTLLLGAVSLLLTTGFVNAQSMTRLGVKGGVNFANMTLNKAGDQDQNKSLTTFNAGLVADFSLSPMFAIRSGLDLQGKGTKYHNDKVSSATLNPLYLELPVNFLLKGPAGPIDLYVGAGPYISYGVAGKNKYTYKNATGENVEVSSNIKWSNDDPLKDDPGSTGQLKRFGFGANVVGGIEFSKRFALNLQYGIGLTNTRPGERSSSSNYKSQHRDFGVSGIVFF